MKRSVSTLLEQYLVSLRAKMKRFIGLPVNMLYPDYSPLYPFFSIPLNNIGDPFVESRYEINSRKMELEVLQYFAELYHISDYWGYITHGGSEGNLCGLYIGREVLGKNAAVFYSQDTHYSMYKNARILRIPHIVVRSQNNGSMDYGDLEHKLQLHSHRDPIIVANMPSTMKGAHDSIEDIIAVLKKLHITHHYIHVDAALGGMIFPFIKNAPIFDFRLPIGSIAVSGHKMFGCPIPCGIIMSHRCNVVKIGKTIEYVGALDTTISGSRNGHTPLLLWYLLQERKDKFNFLM